VGTKKYHIIYKTICTITNSYYIGLHSTNKLEDSYLGSGSLLKKSIEKYGKDNHVKEILFIMDSREEAMLKEKQIVNKELINDINCLNVAQGGEISLTYEAVSQFNKKKWATDKNYASKIKSLLKSYIKRNHELGKINYNTFEGKKHTQETKNKIGEANSKKQKGGGNSQFGTKWVTDGVKNKKVKKDDPLPEGWDYGRI
jgi:hypothetical protein